MRRRFPAAALILSLAVLVLACGGGSSGPTFDTKRADALAHAALINQGDLPGSGWATTEDDKFAKSDDIPDTPNCASTREFNKAADEDVAGKAERQISVKARNNSEPDLAVQLKVMIYNKTERLPGILKQYLGTVGDGSTQKCLLDVIKSELPSSVEISLKQGASTVAAPAGGVSFSFDVEAKAGSDSATLREEHFAWLRGNAAVSLDIQGPPSLVTQDLINAAIQKTQAALDAAAKSK